MDCFRDPVFFLFFFSVTAVVWGEGLILELMTKNTVNTQTELQSLFCHSRGC